MKDLWDKAQPDYKHLTAEHLTTQVTRILNKGLIYETRFNITTEDSEAIVGTQEVLENDNMEWKENTVERDEMESVKQERSHNKEAEGNETDVNDKNPEDEISNKRMDETAVLEMVELIRPAWGENFEYFLKVDLKDRIYTTRKDRRISDIEIEATNRIMDQIIKETGDSISLWDINVMQYTTAITLISRHGKLREKKTEKRQ